MNQGQGRRWAYALFLVFLLGLAQPLHAADPSDFGNPVGDSVIPNDPGAFVKEGNIPFNVLNTAISVVFYALMLLAILFILVAAFNYMTAAGNAEKVEKAQKQILYAVIAIVIAILARSIPFIVSNFVKNNVTRSSSINSNYDPCNDPNVPKGPDDCQGY